MDSSKQPTRSQRLATLGGLAVLLLFSVLLRAWALTWGVPNADRYYPYHPDEPVLLNAVCQVNPLWLDFTPRFYNYGTFFILVTRLIYDFAAPVLGWGSVPRFDLPFERWVDDFGQLLLVGRWVSVAAGAATVVALFGLGRRLFGARTGWLAAFFLAVAPLPVLLAHYMTVDITSAFLVTLTLYLGAGALDNPDAKSALRWMTGAAFVGGLAVGTKYNCFPALLPLAVPIWQLWRREHAGRKPAAAVAAIALAAATAFLLSTPGALLESQYFLGDVLYEMGRNADGQGLIFIATPPTVVYHLAITFPVALEWPLFLLTLAGLGWSLRRRSAQDAYLLLFVVPFFLLLLPAERKFLRYVTPMVPALLVLAARLLDAGLGSRLRNTWAAGGAVCAIAAFASTVAHLGVMSAPDARDQAAAYLREHATPTQVVALASDAWHYTPPIHPTAGAVKYSQAYGGPPVWDLELALGRPRPEITPLPQFQVLAPRSVVTEEFPVPAGALRVDQLRAREPEWVVITDYEYEDPERIRKADPSFTDGRLDLLAALSERYVLEREFRPRPRLAGFTWWSRGIPPHDWRYYMPTVRIYRRTS